MFSTIFIASKIAHSLVQSKHKNQQSKELNSDFIPRKIFSVLKPRLKEWGEKINKLFTAFISIEIFVTIIFFSVHYVYGVI